MVDFLHLVKNLASRAQRSDRIGGDFRELRDLQPALSLNIGGKGPNSRPAA